MAIVDFIYSKFILTYLLTYLQNGFRRGRSTSAQILSLRRIVEETRNANREMTLVFVDFRKAFDTINRNTLFEILPLYGIPPKLIKAIQALYQNTSATIITPDGTQISLIFLQEYYKVTILPPFYL